VERGKLLPEIRRRDTLTPPLRRSSPSPRRAQSTKPEHARVCNAFSSLNKENIMIGKLLFAVGIGYLFRRFTGSRSRGAGAGMRW
jgi:hypothetical protein